MDPRLPRCFAGYPAAVLHVSSDGIVIRSNGRFERELDRVVVGRAFAAILDQESSSEKWSRVIHSLGAAAGAAGAVTCELVLATGEAVSEPRSFSVLWDDDAGFAWVIEHPHDPRLDDVRHEVLGVNTELANAQRDLVRERGRLESALIQTEQATEQVSQQYALLAAQNKRLLAMTDELNEQQLALERSNGLLDEFARSISHDLTAPLRSIANYARWIEEDLGDTLTGEPRAHMGMLRAEVQRMRDMIDSILEYARAARIGGRVETVDVSALLDEVIATLDPPPTCVIDIMSDLPVLTTERAPLRQVFLNLIGNAIRHAGGDDLRIEVGASDAGAAYDFFVRDNGRGIAAGAEEKIRLLFPTAFPRDGRSVDGDGTGIGLAAVRPLVESHGGRAWVESTEGHVATFHFLWPKLSTSRTSDTLPVAGSASDRGSA